MLQLELYEPRRMANLACSQAKAASDNMEKQPLCIARISHCAWHEWHDLDFGGFLRSIPTPNSWTTKSLTCWFHPGMKLPACLASVNMKAVRDGVAVNYASDSVRCGHMDVMSPAASREGLSVHHSQ